MADTTLTPLRRGPAEPDAADQIRSRILDAATACLLDLGVTGRLHAQIAQRAGLSRPTVYKYVGDQSAILAAVFDREFEIFLATVLPRLRVDVHDRTDLVDGVVLFVEYARNHALLQKALREQPEYVLPALTTHADPILNRVVEVFAAPLAALLHADASRGAMAAEWFFRLIVSLIVTPGHAGTTPTELRRHLNGLLEFGLQR